MAKPGRHREGEETREKVLAAARKLIAENGYSATSISMISKASGVKPASIYWAFDSKEGLLAAVLERAADDFFTSNDHLGEHGQTSVRQMMEATAETIAAQPDFLRLLLIMSTERQKGDPRLLEAARHIRDLSRQGIEARLDPFVSARTERQRKAILHDASRLAIMLFDGTFVSMQLEPEESSIKHLAHVVAVAVEGAIAQLTQEQKTPTKAAKQKRKRDERATEDSIV